MKEKIFSLFPDKFMNLLRFYWRKHLQDKKKLITIKNKKKIIKKYGKVNLNELFLELKKLGLKKSDVVFFQNSFNDMPNISFKPIDLLNRFFKFLGKDGSIFVPCFTHTSEDINWVFDLNNEPTYTGIFNELFRRDKKVIRSIHPRHSICGFGKYKLTILKDHHKCKYSCGKNSPFDRLRKLKNSKILTLGLPKGYISFLHWMDDIDQKKKLRNLYNKKPNIYKYYTKNRTIRKIKDYKIKKKYRKNLNYKKIINNLPQDKIIFKNYKGIHIGIYELKTLSKELMNLKKKGYHLYMK